MAATLFDNPIVEPAPVPFAAGSLAERMPPRDYQQEAVDEFLRAYTAGERHMLYRLATGTGKTLTASLTAEHWLAMDADHRVLVLAYERGLVQQFRDEIAGFLPDNSVGLEMGSDGSVGRNVPDITVGSRQSLYVTDDDQSRLYKFDAVRYNWLIVCDEAHGWKYGLTSCRHIVDWFERNPDSAWLGLTATPERGDGVSLRRLFGHNCVEMRLTGAITEGYLVPFRQKFISVEGVDFKNLREIAGDFDDAELGRILSEREQLLAMAIPLLETVGQKRTLVFVPGVECARQLAATITAEIKARGLPHGHAEYMVGATPTDERERIIRGHQANDFQFLVVCGLCRAGYNDPTLEAVAVFRPTKSKVMAEQMKGRGVRPMPGILRGLKTSEERRRAIANSDKPNCLVVDMVGVSGMAEVASTAHLLATGEEDEVIDRANERLQRDDNEETVEEAIGKSRTEIREEREAARREAEERKRREREEYERRARIRGQVDYRAREVNGTGGAHASVGSGSRPTDNQLWYLVHKANWREEAAVRLSKRQASAVIGKHKAKSGGEPPTNPQRYFLERRGLDVPRTKREASHVIGRIKAGEEVAV